MGKYSFLLVVLGSILWGGDSLFRLPLTEDLSPITIVFLEHLILSIIMLPILLRSLKEIRALEARDWLALTVIAIGGSVAATSLYTYSIKYGNASVTVLLQKTQPLFAITLARLFLHERPGRWFWHCCLPALAGAYLVSTPDWRVGFQITAYRPISIASALGAAALWGSSTVLGRYIVARVSIPVLTGLRFVSAFPLLALLFFLQPATSQVFPKTMHASFMLLAMALIPGLLALVLYYKGLQSTIASMASVAELAFPITAVVSNWAVLNILLTLSQLLGGALLVGSVTTLTYLDARAKSRQPAQLAVS